MNKRILIVVAIGLLTAVACGDKPEKAETPAPQFTADSLLPARSGTLVLDTARVSRTPEELVKMLGVYGSGTYRKYDVVGVTAARYSGGPEALFVEIAQFAGPLDAYGLYSLTRPVGADTMTLGTETYVSGKSMYMVQGDYVVTISVMGEPESVVNALLPLAVTISAKIGQTEPLDSGWSTLPADSTMIVPSTRYTTAGFLGVTGVTGVFSATYVPAGDTLELFVADDSGGTKFLALTETTGHTPENSPAPEGFAFDIGFGVMYDRADEGTVLLGLKGGRLVGAVGYNHALHEAFVKRWVEGLPEGI